MTATSRATFVPSAPCHVPDAADVKNAFDAAGGEAEGLAWLADMGIAPPPIPIKLLRVVATHAWEVPGGEFDACESVFFIEPGEPNCLAFPILSGDGDMIDLGLIGLAGIDFHTALQQADWLGYDNLAADVVRLHTDPLTWLDAGCTGVVQIHPYQRGHMTALRRAKRLECNDIALALEAWEWGFAAHDADLARFEVDDDPVNIRAYFERLASRSARAQLRQARVAA